MPNDCLFCKIIRREIPAEIVYEDDEVLVFPDIHPIKPVHLLIIPKQHVSEFITVENGELFKNLSMVVQKMIKEKKLDDVGYKIMMNGGGHQDVNHLHIHLTGPMGKPSA